MTLSFFTFLTLISFFLTSILSIFFFVTKKGYKRENRILALLLVIFNLQIFNSFSTSTYAFQYFMDWHKFIYVLRQTALLTGPIIYFYVNSFLKKKDIIDYRSLVHFIPFISVVIFLMIAYRQMDYFVIWEYKLDLYDTILILVHNLIYILLSLLSLRSMNIGFRGFYKRIKISPHNTWLQMLLLGFILIWMVNLNSFALYMIVKRPSWCAYTGSIFALTVFLFVNTIMFFILLNPDVYYIITKYKNNKLREADKKEYLQRLNSYIETNKAYLNPEITLESLAEEISVNSRTLSQIINETFNKNFKAYILEYRIKESMQLLADENYSKMTVLEILYKVGFNSKSAFNNQFKLYTNLTPLEYRAKFIA